MLAFAGSERCILEVLCITIGTDTDLQSIRIEEADKWFSCIVTTFINLIISGGGATDSLYVYLIVFVSVAVEGIVYVMKRGR